MKIAIFAALDTFIRPVADALKSRGHEVKVTPPFIAPMAKDLADVDSWADVVWVDFCDELMVRVSQYPFAKPLVCRVHSYEVFTDYPEKVKWQNVRLIVFVAEHIRTLFHQLHPGVTVPSVVIPNLLAAPPVALLGDHVYSKRVGYAGYINYKKNPGLLVQCFKTIYDHDPEFTFHVAGEHQDPRIQVYMEEFIARNALPVTFHGWQKDVASWWRGMDYAISTSYLESFCYGIAEGVIAGAYPLVHRWVGAENVYPEEWMFETPNQCLMKILRHREMPQDARGDAAVANEKFLWARYGSDAIVGEIEKVLDTLTAQPVAAAFSSADYWDARHAAGEASATRSAKLTDWKAEVINKFIEDAAVGSVFDHGCGDGILLSKLSVPDYCGFDVSGVAVEACKRAFPDKRFALSDSIPDAAAADLGLSVSVIYHLVEDDVFDTYMARLFGHATRYVLVFSTNYDEVGPPPHMRHRRFTDWVAATCREWELVEVVRNPMPDEGVGDFYVFRKMTACASRQPDDASAKTEVKVPDPVPFKPAGTGITLCMIVKNEEVGLERAINSARSIIDDIVVVIDDSTTDKTAAIAEALGARVYHRTWTKDFSAARNEAQSYVKTKWALILDGHEYLDGDLAEITNAINGPMDLVGLLLLVEMENGSMHRSFRLHRIEGATWANETHNSLTIRGMSIVLSPAVRVVHDRASGQSEQSLRDRAEQRTEMHLDYFPRLLKQNPDSPRAMYYLAQQLRDMGDYGGAIYWLERCSRSGGPDPDDEKFAALFQAGVVAMGMKDLDTAESFAYRAIRMSSDRGEGWALLGDVWYERAKYNIALVFYTVAAGCTVPENAIVGIDLGLCDNGWKVMAQAILCFEHMGQYENAVEICRRVLAIGTIPPTEIPVIEAKREKLLKKIEYMAGGEKDASGKPVGQEVYAYVGPAEDPSAPPK